MRGSHAKKAGSPLVEKKNINLEARVGFEPTNGGFADLSLGPLGYRAELSSIAKVVWAPGRNRRHPVIIFFGVAGHH